MTIFRAWPLILAVMLPGPVSAAVSIRLTDGGRPQVVVDGLPDGSLSALTESRLERADWEAILAIYVADQPQKQLLAVLGDYRVAGSKLIFTPRFPLKPGLSYRAVFNPVAIPGAHLRGKRVETMLSAPAQHSAMPTVVEVIYPSSDVLPENQLKFYLYFSKPMSRGNSYEQIRLLDATGDSVEAPFLELAEELWDESGRRLTLLMDPGRVKQDLIPHKEVGRAIADRGRYTLIIRGEWRDALGTPIGGEFRKDFSVTKADVVQPNPKRWRLTIPNAGTRLPLVVDFDEPLDYAMLQHAIQVLNTKGEIIEGTLTVDKQETRWSLLPTVPWVDGTYRLLIESNLEDLAGNSIARPFEVYLPAGRPANIGETVVPFQIGKTSIRSP
jgi:hypothetical protein